MSDELTPPPGALYEYHALATRLGEMSKTAGSLATSLNDMQFELQDRMMQHLQTDSRMMRTPTELMCSGLTGLTGMSRSVDNDDGGVDKNADHMDADVASRQTAKCSHPKCSFECHQAPHLSFAGFCCGRCRACFGAEGAPECFVHGKKCSAVVWSPEIQLTQETQVDLSEETKVDLCETEVDDLRLKIRRCK